MATTKKITKKDYFTTLLNNPTVLANLTLPEGMTADGMTAFLVHEIELLDKKNATERKATPNQIANEATKKAMIDFMEIDKPYLISDLIKECPACEGMATSKVSRLAHDLVKAGYVERIEEKRKAYFIRRG
jgi:hypothetical protein